MDMAQLYQENWDITAIEMGETVPPAFWWDIGGTGRETMKAVIRMRYTTLDMEAYIAARVSRPRETEEVYAPEKPGLWKILDFFEDCGVQITVTSGSARPARSGSW